MAGEAAAAVSIGSAIFGGIFGHSARKRQAALEQQALEMNLKQARLKASESAAFNAQSFRKALASQVSLGASRGASSTLLATYGQESYKNFLADQRAIELGLDIAELQGAISREEINAKKKAGDLAAYTKFAQLGLRGINFSAPFGGSYDKL